MALSDADGMTRFYPAGGDQAAAPGFVQRFPKTVSHLCDTALRGLQEGEDEAQIYGNIFLQIMKLPL